MTASAPLYAAIMEYCQRTGLRLHMPGHAGHLEAFPEPFRHIVDFDLTEVPGLDDLHCPSGPIEAAQQLMARAFGARTSKFLVNGASSGIHSFFMGLGAGARVLVARNAHRSFFAGMVMSGAYPVYIPCQVSESGLALAVAQKDIESLLAKNAAVDAAAIVNPTYFGTTAPIDRIARLLHENGIPILVDEAHGGHFYFHPHYPHTALAAGADAVVNGLHKTLPVLTQGACLHIGESCPEPERFLQAASLLTTTSPSYVIMASIDLAREWMECHGREALEQAWQLSCVYRDKIDHIKGFNTIFPELMVTGTPVDPLKILISVQNLAEDGYAVSRRLRLEWGIEVEWASSDNILAMMSIFHQQSDWERLYQALRQISKQVGCRKANAVVNCPPLPEPQVGMSPREAYFAPKRIVPLKSSIGRLCGEMVVPYPPGIPCLLPGENITAEVCAYIGELKQTGRHLQGGCSGDYITIIEES